jgi:hypothetical protein
LQAREDAGMTPRLLAALLAAAFVGPAGASVLYKSVDANGTITFSDIPPPAGSHLLEQRMLGTRESNSAAASPASPAGLEEAFQWLDSDKALAEANARVDLAERALALARAGHATTPRPGLNKASISVADHERGRFYMRDLRVARQALTDLLRSRQLASGRPLS